MGSWLYCVSSRDPVGAAYGAATAWELRAKLDPVHKWGVDILGISSRSFQLSAALSSIFADYAFDERHCQFLGWLVEA
jgi:hypothetical protein